MDARNYQPTLETVKQIARWLQGNHTGASSKFMACIAMGYEPGLTDHVAYPADSADFGRCVKLVEQVPGVRDAFERIAQSSSQWRGIINNWEELEDLYDGIRLHAPEKDDVFGTVFRRKLLEYSRPHDYEAQLTFFNRRQEEQAKLEEDSKPKPTHSKLGVPYAPKPENHPDIHLRCLNSACFELEHSLRVYVSPKTAKSIQDSVLAACFDCVGDVSQSGGYWFKECGFDVSDTNAPDILEAFNAFHSDYENALDECVYEWVVKNAVKPSLSVGQPVRFKHGFDVLEGVIYNIENTKHTPMSYVIDIGGKGKGMPVIRWDDDSLEIVDMTQNAEMEVKR